MALVREPTLIARSVLPTLIDIYKTVNANVCKVFLMMVQMLLANLVSQPVLVVLIPRIAQFALLQCIVNLPLTINANVVLDMLNRVVMKLFVRHVTLHVQPA